MSRLVGMFVIAAALALSFPAWAEGPSGTLVVRNQTDATMEILRDRELGLIVKIPVRTVLVLEGYLPLGRHEVQVTAPCVAGVEYYFEPFWVSGNATASNVLVITPDKFGKSLMFDKPDCGVGPDIADTYGRCVEYAQKALYQGRLGEENGCRFKGDMWSDKLAVHIAWCLAAQPGELAAKAKARTEALARCEADKSKRPWCEEYAREASTQSTVANVHGCGFSGELWNAEVAVHYDYCMAVDREEAQGAQASRAKAVQDCLDERTLDLFCENFAAACVRMQQDNLDQGCGLEGAAWTLESAVHYEACIQAGQEDAEKSLAAQQAMLDQCRERKEREKAEEQARQDALDTRCGAYADQAVAQYNESQSLGCGFRGDRWLPDYGAHYNWCLGATDQQTGYEASERQKELDACRAKMSREGTCRQYANTAVDQYATSQAMGCGFGGDRWQDNYDNHFNWCMGATDQQTVYETTERQKALAACASRANQNN